MVAVNVWIQWQRSPGKTGSHFDPSSDLFLPNERKDVLTSTACWAAMLGLLVGLGFVIGPIQLLKLYGVPYMVNFFPLSIISMIFRFWVNNEWNSHLTFLASVVIRYVVGLGNLFAPSWPWRQVTLVSWKGTFIRLSLAFLWKGLVYLSIAMFLLCLWKSDIFNQSQIITDDLQDNYYTSW